MYCGNTDEPQSQYNLQRSIVTHARDETRHRRILREQQSRSDIVTPHFHRVYTELSNKTSWGIDTRNRNKANEERKAGLQCKRESRIRQTSPIIVREQCASAAASSSPEPQSPFFRVRLLACVRRKQCSGLSFSGGIQDR